MLCIYTCHVVYVGFFNVTFELNLSLKQTASISSRCYLKYGKVMQACPEVGIQVYIIPVSKMTRNTERSEKAYRQSVAFVNTYQMRFTLFEIKQ